VKTIADPRRVGLVGNGEDVGESFGNKFVAKYFWKKKNCHIFGNKTVAKLKKHGYIQKRLRRMLLQMNNT
jgi:hypothetical protein